MKAIGYARTSTQKQDLGLDVQEKRLKVEAEFRGIEMEIVQEKISGTVSPLMRPGLSQILAALREGTYDTLIVAKLDRVARSMGDIAILLESAKKEGWNFIALDLGVDTSTPEGTLVVGIMASIAQWERARIQERTREALGQAKAQGKRLGRPRVHNEKAIQRATELREAGFSLAKVSEQMFDEGFASSKGTRISDSSILRLLEAAA